jgi:hypothetical protein
MSDTTASTLMTSGCNLRYNIMSIALPSTILSGLTARQCRAQRIRTIVANTVNLSAHTQQVQIPTSAVSNSILMNSHQLQSLQLSPSSSSSLSSKICKTPTKSWLSRTWERMSNDVSKYVLPTAACEPELDMSEHSLPPEFTEPVSLAEMASAMELKVGVDLMMSVGASAEDMCRDMCIKRSLEQSWQVSEEERTCLRHCATAYVAVLMRVKKISEARMTGQ